MVRLVLNCRDSYDYFSIDPRCHHFQLDYCSVCGPCSCLTYLSLKETIRVTFINFMSHPFTPCLASPNGLLGKSMILTLPARTCLVLLFFLFYCIFSPSLINPLQVTKLIPVLCLLLVLFLPVRLSFLCLGLMFLGSQTQCHLFSENIPELANPVGSLLVSMICKRARHWALQWACDGECRHGFIMKVLRLKLHSPLICMNPTQDPWKSPKYVHRVRCVCKNLTAIGLDNAKPTFWFILYQAVTNASSYAIVIAMGICTPSVYLLKENL